MSRLVTLDLDRPGDVDRLWQEMERRHEAASVFPQLRRALIETIPHAVRTGRLSDEEAEEVAELLSHAHPKAVLAAWPQLVPERPALGPFASKVTRAPVPPPPEVMKRAPRLLADEPVPLGAGLVGLADHFIALGCEPAEVEHAFRDVFYASGSDK